VYESPRSTPHQVLPSHPKNIDVYFHPLWIKSKKNVAYAALATGRLKICDVKYTSPKPNFEQRWEMLVSYSWCTNEYIQTETVDVECVAESLGVSSRRRSVFIELPEFCGACK
jgi:hypothetical protein